MKGRSLVVVVLGLLAVGCKPKAGEQVIGKTDHCNFATAPPVAHAGGSVTPGSLSAGAAEVILPVPVGTALGSYTGRASFGGSGVAVDGRVVPFSGAFAPSIGVETAPRVKALALATSDETVLILKADLGYTYEGHTFELEQRLGPEFAGKILITASHSHSAWGQYSGHQGIGTVGSGQLRREVYDAFMDAYQQAARNALDNLQPARIGVSVDTSFDPTDQINRDRRSENDVLSGGASRDDTTLYMIRVESTAGDPIAAVPVFGMHGTLQDYDNSLASTDASGGLERLFQEQFDTPVVVMHLQGSIGDVSPVGHGDLDCALKPGNPQDPCFTWLTAEGLGRVALPVMVNAWQAAGDALADTVALEAVSRPVELGPDRRTFNVRGGSLQYAHFDGVRRADGVMFEGSKIASPIDEFNAVTGAALCGEEDPLFPSGTLPGTSGLAPYQSCLKVHEAAFILGAIMGVEFESDETHPICQSTRTTLSAVRIGDYVIAGMPGEVTTYYADEVRALSPRDAEHTIVLSFVNGHVGYLLTPEDWMLAGYEPSINFWGPLEAEYLAESVEPLLQMVTTDTREDARVKAPEWVLPRFDGDTFTPDPAPLAGTVPDPVDAQVWSRTGTVTNAQPDPTIERVAGIARFVWIGEDPLETTPMVTLQREVSPNMFDEVLRRSQRTVSDGDIMLGYTPLPLNDDGSARTYYWTAEWQAVPPLGDPNSVNLTDYLAVEAGAYRFHVVGDGYNIFSDPFDVVPATLGVTASRNANNITVVTTIQAPTGFRLLSLDSPSNQPVPVQNPVDVSLALGAGGTLDFTGVTPDATGTLVLDAGGQAADVVSATVTDTHANTGTGAL